MICHIQLPTCVSAAGIVGFLSSRAADIESIGREALTDVRRAANGYRGAGLDRELARAQSALGAAGVALAAEQRPAEGGALSDDTDALLGWVVREAVTNVVRHAQATRCTVTIDRTEGGIRLDISDDGPGLADVSPPGVGLRGLEERVAAAGGRFDADHTGQGFRLAVDVPSHAEVTTP